MDFVKAYVLIIYLQSVRGGDYKKELEIIEEYINLKNIRSVTSCLCWPKRYMQQLHQRFYEFNLYYNIICENVTIQGGHRTNHVSIFDARTCESFNILQEVIKYQVLDERNKLLIFADETDIRKILKNAILRLDSDVIIVYLTNAQVIWYDVYSFKGKIQYIMATPQNNKIHLPSRYTTRKDLTGLNVTFVTSISKSFADYAKPSNPAEPKFTLYKHVYLIGDNNHLHFTDNKNKHIDNIQKLNYNLLLLLQKVHNFSLVINITEGDERMVDLQDLGIIGSTTFLDREVVSKFDILIPSYKYRTALLYFLKNVKNVNEKNVYLSPLGNDVWFAVVGSTVLIIALLRIVYTFDEKLNVNLSETDRINSEEGKPWSSVISDTLAILIQQGSTYEPVSISGKVILFTYLALAVLIFNYYSSVMVSDLLSKPPSSFKHVSDLMGLDIEIGIENSNQMIQIFKNFSTPEVNYLVASKINKVNLSEHVYDLEEGLRKIREENIAFCAHKDSAYPLSENIYSLLENCDVGELIFHKPIDMFMYLPKNNEFRELFKITFRRLFETSMVDYVNKNWLTKKPLCLANRDVEKVGLKECIFVLYLFLCGFVLSGVFLLCEIFMNSSRVSDLREKYFKYKRGSAFNAHSTK